MLICSFTHTHILMTIVGFWSPFFLMLVVEKQEEENSLVSLISPKIQKKREKDAMEQRLIEWNNDHTSSFTPVSLSLLLSLYHHIQKMTKRAKSRSLRALLMKNELVVRMLIMIIFLVPIGDWLVFHRFFLIGSQHSAKKIRREKEGKHNLLLGRREKKRRQRREKDFLYIILTFSRSRRFFLFLSLSLSSLFFFFSLCFSSCDLRGKTD